MEVNFDDLSQAFRLEPCLFFSLAVKGDDYGCTGASIQSLVNGDLLN